MIKTKGISSCEKKGINIFGEKSFKKNLYLKVDEDIKEIETINTNVEIIKVYLDPCRTISNSTTALNIFFKINLKIAYSIIGFFTVKIYTLTFYEDIKIWIPYEIQNQLENYTLIEGEENCKVYVEKLKAYIDNNTLSLAFYITATASFKRFQNIHFKISFDNGEENIFTYNLVEESLRQRTFYFNNKIEYWHLKEDEGVVLVRDLEKEQAIYTLLGGGMNKVILLENPGTILKVIRICNEKLVVIAKKDNKVNIYLYNQGFLDIMAEDIYDKVMPVYDSIENYLLYVRKVEEEFSIIKRSLEGEESVVFNLKEPITGLKLLDRERKGAVIVNFKEIILFDLSSGSLKTLLGDKNSEDLGNIIDLKFTDNEEILLIKTIKEDKGFLYEVFVSRGIARNVAKEEESIVIDDFSKGFYDNHIYLSTWDKGKTCIYDIDLTTLEKEVLLEINCDKINFLEN